MLKKLLALLSFLLFFILAANLVLAQEKTTINFFYSKTCPHCHDEAEFLKNYQQENNNFKINSFEVSSFKNTLILQEAAKKLKITGGGVPVTIIGEKYIIGFGDENSTGQEIKSLVENCQENSCPDVVGEIIDDLQKQPSPSPAPSPDPENIKDNQNLINLPILGQVNPKAMSLPVLTIIIGLLDGFNPCAMWTLVFLISLLLGLQDKKRMWLLGSVFILVSGFIYFLFMSAWLNLFLFLGLILIVRLAIGGFAIAAGVYNLREYWINKDGACKVSQNQDRQAVFEKIKIIIHKQSLWLALAGIALLAIAVNLVEMLCSAGLPAVYTQVLSLNNLPIWQYYGYLGLYILFFMLDDLAVFFIAMKTLHMVGIDSKYARYSRLIGGIIILLIGVLMIFKPEWLTFG